MSLLTATPATPDSKSKRTTRGGLLRYVASLGSLKLPSRKQYADNRSKPYGDSRSLFASSSHKIQIQTLDFEGVTNSLDLDTNKKCRDDTKPEPSLDNHIPTELSLDQLDAIILRSNEPVGGGNHCDLLQGTSKLGGPAEFALKRPRCFDQEELADILRKFDREARIWTMLRHPNVLPFYGVVERSKKKYLVSPWVAGGDLHNFLSARSKHLALPVAQQMELPNHDVYVNFDELDMIYGIAKGIAYLHAHPENIIHGDLKPQNILLGHAIQPLICDFGMTKDNHHSVTSLGMKGKGSRRWQAPELLMNSPKTRETDMYAFSMTIVQILTGDLPLPHIQSDGALVMAIGVRRETPVPKPMSFRGRNYKALWDIAARCWDWDPLKRPSADEVLLALEEAKNDWPGI